MTSGAGYLDDAQPNLSETFACVAEVGTAGDGNEIQMEALTEALEAGNAPGARLFRELTIGAKTRAQLHLIP